MIQYRLLGGKSHNAALSQFAYRADQRRRQALPASTPTHAQRTEGGAYLSFTRAGGWSLRSFAGKNPCKDDVRRRTSEGPHVIP